MFYRYNKCLSIASCARTDHGMRTIVNTYQQHKLNKMDSKCFSRLGENHDIARIFIKYNKYFNRNYQFHMF